MRCPFMKPLLSLVADPDILIVIMSCEPLQVYTQPRRYRAGMRRFLLSCATYKSSLVLLNSTSWRCAGQAKMGGQIPKPRGCMGTDKGLVL